jgi:[ribosomal protein S18]-alanine N-acetyltransferase
MWQHNWKFEPLTEEQGRQICTWRYPAPYDVYNLPSWEHMAQNREEFADPLIRAAQYRAVLSDAGMRADGRTDGDSSLIASQANLCGFAQFFPMADVTRLGFGLHPDLCSQGSGVSFVCAITDEALRCRPNAEIDLEVLTWNKRAIRTYLKAGFLMEDTYERMGKTGMIEVHCMVFKR